MPIKRGAPVRARDFHSAQERMASNIVIPGSNRLQSGSDVVMQAEGRRRGGNGFTIRLVASLPALPELGVQMVLWGTSDMITDGTGDGQVWIASSNDSQWAPLYNYTDLSGDPSS